VERKHFQVESPSYAKAARGKKPWPGVAAASPRRQAGDARGANAAVLCLAGSLSLKTHECSHLAALPQAPSSVFSKERP
jgi:hypothetical protein